MAVTMFTRAGVLLAAAAATGAVVLTSLPAGADMGAPTSTATKTVTRSPSPFPRLIDIRTGRHATFDRVVFDLRGAAPGYKVGYVDTVRQDPSGKLIDLRGGANLMVRLRPAQAHRSDGSSTYTGSKRIFVDDPELREVAFAGDFEGVVSIALGQRDRLDLRLRG